MNLRLSGASIPPLLICACLAVVGSAQNPLVSDPSAQISEYVRRVFQDRDGHLWFGTNGDGVCRYDGKSLDYFSVEAGFAGRAVRGIVQDSGGALWFGTDGGVSRYEDGRFHNFTVANGLSDNDVWSMMLDRSGTVWVGTMGGVCCFVGEAFVPFPIPRTEVESPDVRFSPLLVWSMFEDQAGNFWFGTDGEGVRRYDGKSFTTFTKKDGLAGNQVGCIAGDRRGRIWFGAGSGGVSCYDGNTFQTFTVKDGLSDGRVWTMLEDKAGNLWISTLGQGVCRYDGESFTAFGASSGLTRSHVQSIFEDRDGTLWFGCSGGLFRFDGKSFVNVTRNGPWQEPAPVAVANPMAGFARLVTGEWRVTFTSGTSMFRVWQQGPGQHSLRAQTYGAGAGGEPWRDLEVIYWHPGRQQVCLLGLSPFASGVSEGTIGLEGDTADAVFDLYQTGGRREMGRRRVFDGPDRYRETLWDAGQPPLGEWEFVRTRTLTATRPRTGGEAPRLAEHLQVFAPLLGSIWEAKGGEALRLQSAFEWVPYADGIYVRTLALTTDGEPTHLLDTYLYRHTGTGALRCLALSNSGGVYEGELTVLEGGALQIDLKGYEGDQVVPHVVRLDFDKDGTLHGRAWSIEGAERKLRLDVHHRKLEAKKD